MKAICLSLIFPFFSSLLVAQENTSDWSHESELGIAISGGNSESQTYHLKHASEYEWAQSSAKGDLSYFYTIAGRKETAKKWAANLRYEKGFSEVVRGFLGSGWRGDVFAGYNYRASVDIGVKYFFYRSENKRKYLFTEVGYQFQYEDRIPTISPPFDRAHFIRLFVEVSHQFSEIIDAKFWLELLPDVSNGKNYQVNLEPSIKVVLSGYFYLKLGFVGRYDAEPARTGNKRFDFIYTTSLVASF